MSNTRNCRECGNELKGRADKKFCDDYCRSAYNYRSSKEEFKSINQIHRILKRNRKILKLFWEAGQRAVDIELLEINGFNLAYVTRVAAQNGKLRFHCYEFGFETLEKGRLKLFR